MPKHEQVAAAEHGIDSQQNPGSMDRQSMIGMRIWDAALVAIGMLLITASALKVAQSYIDPVESIRIVNYSPLLLQVLIAWELLLGLWAISRFYPLTLNVVLAFNFAGFALHNLLQMLESKESCDCLGPLSVPLWAMLGIDVLIVGVAVGSFLAYRSAAPPDTSRRRVVFYGSCYLLICGGAVLSCYSNVGSLEAAEQGASENYDFVILRPRSWIGEPCPVFPKLGLPERVNEGKWKLLFFKEGCRSCEKLLQEAIESNEQWAIVALPPGKLEAGIVDKANVDKANLAFGQISDTRRWHLDTPPPTVLLLADGVVIEID